MDFLQLAITVIAVLIFIRLHAYRYALIYFVVALLIINRIDGFLLTIYSLLAVALLEFLVYLWHSSRPVRRAADGEAPPDESRNNW